MVALDVVLFLLLSFLASLPGALHQQRHERADDGGDYGGDDTGCHGTRNMPCFCCEVRVAARPSRIARFVAARLDPKAYLGLHVTVGLAIAEPAIWLFGCSNTWCIARETPAARDPERTPAPTGHQFSGRERKA